MNNAQTMLRLIVENQRIKSKPTNFVRESPIRVADRVIDSESP
jgi:hypothetical protein